MACYLCGLLDVEPKPKFDQPIMYEVECPVCGGYSISRMVIGTTLNQEYLARKHLLSALSRQTYDKGGFLTITSDNISSLLESIPNVSTPLENIDRVLLFISKQQYRADQIVTIQTNIDYPLVFAHDKDEFVYLLTTLIKQGFLDHQGTSEGTKTHVRLTPAGWQRVVELQKTQRQSDQAFVAMWFSTDLVEAYEKGIKLALEETGFRPYRVDKDEHNEKIDDRIVAEIRRSGLLVADFTGHRGGVYFETGFAMGLGIPVIWTCKETDINNAHFDTRQYNHITWNSATELKSKLILRIEATVPGRVRRN